MAAECAVASGVAVADGDPPEGPAVPDGVDDVDAEAATAVLFPHTKLRQKSLVARLVEALMHSFFHWSHSRDGSVCWKSDTFGVEPESQMQL
jgi:hypothetical protein